MTNGNTGITQTYQAGVFFSAKIKSSSYLYFSKTHIRSSYRSEGAVGRNDRKASIVGIKCADDVAVSVRYVVTVVRI